MNNTIMRTIDVTAGWSALASGKTVFSGTVSCPPGNAGDVTFRSLADTGDEVPWVPGEWHAFSRVDLAEIEVKGTPGDTVILVGGTW